MNIELASELHSYLKAKGYVQPGEQLEFSRLVGGVSNRAVLVKREQGPAWVIKQALDKLRVALDWQADPARIHREAAGLRCLSTVLGEAAVPMLIFEDDEHHLLAMTAVPQPHENWKTMLLEGRLTSAHVQSFASLLANLHQLSGVQCGRWQEFADRSFFESLRLEPYYHFTASQHPKAASFFDRLIHDTLATSVALVHGDYSPKNVLVYQDQLVLLDHEVIHLGDPAFDVGFALTHLLSKAHHLSVYRETFRQAAHNFWQIYQKTVMLEAFGVDYEARVVRHTLACMLARIDGRSPLEYLSEQERQVQRELVLALIDEHVAHIAEVIEKFIVGVSRHENR